MKVSIALATYNGAAFIREQLASFVAQTRAPDELVVTDDGSSDGTVGILEAFREAAPFKTTIVQNAKNLGFTRNFEKAISLCDGDLIFLSDQDDAWLPQKIEVVVQEFESNPSAICVINDQFIADKELVPTGTTMMANNAALGRPVSSYIPGCCNALRKEALDWILPIPDGVTQSVWINRLTDSIGRRIIVRKPLQYYRRHGQNVTNDLSSSTRRVGLLDLLARYGLADVSGRWASHQETNRLLIQRIAEGRPFVEGLIGPSEYRLSVARLEERNRELAARIAIVKLPRWRRPSPVVSLFRSGGYGAAGWMGAAKDLIRERANND